MKKHANAVRHPKDPISARDLDTSVRPQDDFFQYAAGGWLARNPIPPTEAAWGSFHQLHVENEKRLYAIVKKAAVSRAKHGTPNQLVRDFWLSGMDLRRRNALGFAPLSPYLREIEAISSPADLTAFIARAHTDGIDAGWSVGVGPDDHRAAYDMLHIGQGGLSLPDRDYYLKKGEEYESVRTAYRAHIERLLVASGRTHAAAAEDAAHVIALETRLARASMTRVERRDPHAQYNPHSLPALQKLAPQIDWRTYLKAIGTATKRVNVAQPRFISEVAKMTAAVPLAQWRAYLRWHVINGTATILSKEAGDISFDFYGKTLQGMAEQRPLWRRILGVIDGEIGDALGRLYVAEHFPPRAKRDIDALVANVMDACALRIRALEWMSPATKKRALAKLAVIRPKVGYPEKWIAYRGLAIAPGDFFGNVIRANRFEHARQMGKVDRKADPQEWEMTPPTVNAYFHPNKNEIVFPAGILQPPFFDPDAPDAFNYGAIGSVIGHEITHAFDDEGRKFDKNGNLKDWWTKEDAARFEKRAKVLAKQYDAFEPLPGFHINGTLTLGENIADLGGLLIAYDAWQLARKAGADDGAGSHGRAPEQLYFFGLASAERGSIRDAALKKRLVTDPHSPPPYRVNGPFRNIDAFCDAFGVKEGDALYLAPAKRARIW